jgi:hypothetical protein
VVAIVAIPVVGVLAYSQRSTIAARLMERGLEARMGGNIVDDLEDGLHLAPNLVNMMNAAARKLDNQIMAKITHDIMDYHASPVEAAETARDAGVGHLLYYHIVPPLVIPGQKSLYLNGAEKIFRITPSARTAWPFPCRPDRKRSSRPARDCSHPIPRAAAPGAAEFPHSANLRVNRRADALAPTKTTHWECKSKNDTIYYRRAVNP